MTMTASAVDFDLTGKASDEISQEIEHNLWLKGYCMFDMKLEASLDDALDEVKDLRRGECFEAPPPQVVDGILGMEGTGEIAWLGAPKGGDEEPIETPKLMQLTTDSLFYIADCTRPFFSSQGLEGMSISESLIVQGGEALEGAGELTETTCSKWASTFLSAKLMMIYFMGPGDGTLELAPIDEDAEPMTIKTRPDLLVILRCDLIARKHISSGSDYALCSWIMLPSVTGNRGWEALSSDATDLTPGVRDINDWAEARLEVLANLDANDQLDQSVPRAWQRMLRTKYFRNNHLPVAIKGMATHSPGTQDPDVLWRSLNVGIDYVGNVPFSRWNHEEYYDPDPQCYINSHAFTGGICKTSINHGQFIEGIELFDNKFFQISQSEATGMEPQQRHILETSYEGLQMAGYTKKQLMTSYIAVFTGCTNPEAMYINYTQGAGAGNVSQAITSNRTSFVLGIMGPSTSIDCEQASSHMALQVGASAVAPNHDWRNKTGGHSEASITGGVYLTVTPYMWPRFNAYMNPIGRCFTFDASAGGYVRGEACSSVCQKPYTDRIDGEWVVSDSLCIGSMVGWKMTNNGRGASLTAPSAPAQQEAMHGSVSDAGIHVLDMHAIETHGNAILLDDSVEVSAISRLLRHDPAEDEEPLLVGAVKTQVSAQCEACGMTTFLKAMLNISFGVFAPSLHLKQVNPHMEINESGVFMTNEHLPFREQYVFHGCSSRGFNGTNTHIIQWYRADPLKVRTERILAPEDQIAFWPAGGGYLDNASRPSEGYFVIGSFCQWEEPQEMEKISDSEYSYTITMGANSFEAFQICLDQDMERVLHPRYPQATSGSTVAGPDNFDEAAGYMWTIDSRPLQLPAIAGATSSAAIADKESSGAIVEAASKDKPGDKFEVKLSVAGKYRAVTWKKVESADAGSISDPVVQGTYYVMGSWNDYRLQAMTADHEKTLGLFTFDLGPLPLWASRCEFQIVRNKDPDFQSFHPKYGSIASEEWDEAEVEGPDEGGPGRTWCIKGKGGDRFKIEFQRNLESGQDIRRISWHKIAADS
uniref:Type I polyketide synthase n=1 Tax=Gambierdiscus polynesiensis TaxID=439318 RepID=A0A1S6K821_9DINO|nr:type I polyketide synthase [Gambierdiscus polynesiensis]